MRPKEKAQDADRAKAAFAHPDGDHLTMLNAYYAYLNKGKDANWCFQVCGIAGVMCRLALILQKSTELFEFEEFPLSRQRARAAAADDAGAV